MKIVAAMLLALMLSACNPGLIDYPGGYFDYGVAESASVGVSDAMLAPRDAGVPASGQDDDFARSDSAAKTRRVAGSRVDCLD